MNRQESKARTLLPERVATLGQPGQWVLLNPVTGEFATWYPHPGALLCANEDGDTMFLLKPGRDAGPPRDLDVAVRVTDLYERFTHREADGFYNAICPPFRKPVFRGQIAIIRYAAQKDIDEDVEGEVIDWIHAFEEPADYPELWFVGNDQYIIPPGKWRITDAGIEND